MISEPTVLVLDDDTEVRKSLEALGKSVGLEVEAYASAGEFRDAYDPSRPGCLVLDVRLRGTSGLDVQDALRSRGSKLPIIIITGYANVPTSVRALKSGAIDFLQKPVPPKQLLERIRDAIESDRQARTVEVERMSIRERLARLTPREREVMEALVAGHTFKEIAAALNLSVRTVEGHRREVLRKVEVPSVAQLVRVVLHAPTQPTPGSTTPVEIRFSPLWHLLSDPTKSLCPQKVA